MRVVSYNVRYFGHALKGLASTVGPKRRIARALLSLDPLPELVCLQEVETRSVRSNVACSASHPTQLEAFMGRLDEAFAARGQRNPYEAFYFRAHAYRLAKLPLYTTGLAILIDTTRANVEHHNCTCPEPITHHHLQLWKEGKQSRICAHMRLKDLQGRTFHLFNTHMSLPTPFARAFWAEKDKLGYGLNQVEEARRLVDFVHRHAGAEPFVVCGDFNSRPASPVYKYLTGEGGLLGAQEALGGLERKHPTAGFMRLRMHLDHLFSGGAVRWLDLDGSAPFGDPSGSFHGLSDHVPLVGRFELDGAV